MRHFGAASKALRLVEEGDGGLSTRHRAIVSHAIDVGHPWVAAIYDECMETGDVRGLMVGDDGQGGTTDTCFCVALSGLASATVGALDYE